MRHRHTTWAVRVRRQGVVVMAAVAAAAGQGVPTAAAIEDGLALNGVYAALSIGNWAKTDLVYIDQRPVRSTWTIESSCSDPLTCAGQVTSDLGWSAPLRYQSGVWTVSHEVPNWERCPDGSAYPGRQLFRFSPAAPGGRSPVGSPTLAGEDITSGPSGACGVGAPLVIRMPFRLDLLSV